VYFSCKSFLEPLLGPSGCWSCKTCSCCHGCRGLAVSPVLVVVDWLKMRGRWVEWTVSVRCRIWLVTASLVRYHRPGHHRHHLAASAAKRHRWPPAHSVLSCQVSSRTCHQPSTLYLKDRNVSINQARKQVSKLVSKT